MMLAVLLLVACAVLLLRHSREVTDLQARYEDLRSNIDRLERLAQEHLKRAKVDAAALRKNAERFSVMMEEKMHQIYGDLHLYQEGVNQYKNGRYLEGFQISGGRIFITMRNKTSKNLRPRLKIGFLDKHGFVIASVSEFWLFDSIHPGQKRVQDASVAYRRTGAKPCYYTVEE